MLQTKPLRLDVRLMSHWPPPLPCESLVPPSRHLMLLTKSLWYELNLYVIWRDTDPLPCESLDTPPNSRQSLSYKSTCLLGSKYKYWHLRRLTSQSPGTLLPPIPVMKRHRCQFLYCCPSKTSTFVLVKQDYLDQQRLGDPRPILVEIGPHFELHLLKQFFFDRFSKCRCKRNTRNTSH